MPKFSYYSFLDRTYVLITQLKFWNKNPIKPGMRYLNWISLLRIYLGVLSQLLLAKCNWNTRNKTHKAATESDKTPPRQLSFINFLLCGLLLTTLESCRNWFRVTGAHSTVQWLAVVAHIHTSLVVLKFPTFPIQQMHFKRKYMDNFIENKMLRENYWKCS